MVEAVLVPEGRQIFPTLTVEENLALGAMDQAVLEFVMTASMIAVGVGGDDAAGG